MSLETIIQTGVELLRARGHTVTVVTDAAITAPGVPNTDLGSGAEPGRMVVRIGVQDFFEEFFADCATAQEVAQRVESVL